MIGEGMGIAVWLALAIAALWVACYGLSVIL